MIDERDNPIERGGHLLGFELRGVFADTFGGQFGFRGEILIDSNSGQFVGEISDMGIADIAGEIIGDRMSFWKLYRSERINSHAIRYALHETAEGYWTGKYRFPAGLVDVEGEAVCQTIPVNPTQVSLEEFFQRYNQVHSAASLNSEEFERIRRQINDQPPT